MLLEICCNPFQEDIGTKMIRKHSDDRASLAIADGVEYLIYLQSIPYRNLNRVRCS